MARVGGILTPYVAQVFIGISDYLSLSLYCFVALLAGAASIMLPIETSGRDMPDNISELPHTKRSGETSPLLNPELNMPI